MGVTDPKSVAKKIAGAHMMASHFFGEPTLAITSDEADALVKEYQNLCEHYGVSALPAVVELWIGVVTTLGMVYGPRAFVLARKHTGPKKPPGPAQPGSRGAMVYPAATQEPPKNTPQPPVTGLEAAIDASAPNGAVTVFPGGTAQPVEFPQGRIVF